MALVWKCDRCHRTSDAGDIGEPPDDWRETTRPIRGSGGARSTMNAALCEKCDDALYDWWNHPALKDEQPS